MPKVSVIMPAYNAERYIGEAIASVLAQTFQDWELIVVDDGSTDTTPEILATFADSRIQVVHQSNGGEASARNTALNLTAGEYIAFLDADDLYLPSGLADMVNYLESHRQFDVVYSDGVMCDQDKKPLMRLSGIRPGIYEGNILEQLVVSNIITVPVCTAVRRGAIEALDLRFDPALKYGVDRDFWTQLARTSEFGYLPALTCEYRVHGSNMTSSVGSRKRKDDLALGQLKVMNADWFPELSASARRGFFYNLLVSLLADNPEQQQICMQSLAFQTLPVAIQADLLRQVASKHLSQRHNTEFAVYCLRRSLTLHSSSRRSRMLLCLADWSPSLAATALSGWRVAHNVQVRIGSLGRRQPRPVPEALLPAPD